MHIDMYINASMAAAVILLLSIFISNLLWHVVFFMGNSNF